LSQHQRAEKAVSIPSLISKDQVSGCVLAGGLSRRMGKNKAWLKIGGKALIQHSVDLLNSHASNVLISANQNVDLYQSLGCDVVTDCEDGYQGPLMGILSALKSCQTPWLIFLPCDLPYLPHDTVSRLLRCQLKEGTSLVIAKDEKRLQPLVGLIHTSLAPSLEVFLQSSGRKVEEWVRQQSHAEADFSDALNAFTNINTKDDWESAQSMPTILGISAWSGTGKTTLLKKLLPRLNDAGVRVGVIKHAHHAFEVDHPGKDSYEIRKSGAAQMLIASDQRWALMADNPTPKEPVLSELLGRMDLDHLDLVLVEGFKHDSIPKVELHRPSLGKPLIYPEDPNVIAVATDEPDQVRTSLPVLNLQDVEAIQSFITALMDRS
jgi:molybdopterin-guanine dinucleotide biosynthesis protein